MLHMCAELGFDVIDDPGAPGVKVAMLRLPQAAGSLSSRRGGASAFGGRQRGLHHEAARPCVHHPEPP